MQQMCIILTSLFWLVGDELVGVVKRKTEQY